MANDNYRGSSLPEDTKPVPRGPDPVGLAATLGRRASSVLTRWSPTDADDLVGEAVSPHVPSAGGGQGTQDPSAGYGGDGVAPSAQSTGRLVLAALAGFAGAVLIVGTSPWWHLAPADAWRLNVPGLATSGNPFYAAATFVLGLVLLAVGWLGLVGHMSRGVGPSRQRLKLVIAIGLLWSIPFMLAPIQLSTDAYSYSAQGDLASLGFDPSTVGPNKLPNHATNKFWAAADPVWRNSPAPYGPLAVATEKAVVTVTGFDVSHAVWGFRALAVFGVVLSGVGVFVIARSRRLSPPLALALAIANPVVLVHLVGGAHNDALMMGLLIIGMAAFERSRKVLAVVLITLAVAVKLPAILALAFVAWNWKGRDARWQERLIDFPIVGGIAVAVLGVLSAIAGIGFGWITALSGTGSVYSTFSVFTKLGFLSSDLLNAVGLNVDAIQAVGIARALGLLVAAGLIGLLVTRSHRYGATKSLGLALLIITLCGPVVWPWYMPAGFALLAAAGVKRFRPTLIVLIIASSALVFPTSVNPIQELSRYQHWLGFGVVLLIVALCVAAQYIARLQEDHRTRLTIGGRRIDQVLVGPAATPMVAAAGTGSDASASAAPVSSR